MPATSDHDETPPTHVLVRAVRDAIAGLLEADGRVSPWFDGIEAAAYLGVAEGTLRNWTSMRYVPHVKRGRLVRYHRDELDRWLAGGACRGLATRANGPGYRSQPPHHQHDTEAPPGVSPGVAGPTQ